MYGLHRLTLTHRWFFSLVLYSWLSCTGIPFSHAQDTSEPSMHTKMTMYYSLRSYGLAKSSSSWSKVYKLTGTTLVYEYHLNSSMGEHDKKETQTKVLSRSQIATLVSLLKKVDRSFNETRKNKDSPRILEATLQVKADRKISWRLRGPEQMVLKDRVYLAQFFPLKDALNQFLSSK